MALSRRVSTVVLRRGLSTVAVESPRVTIARNILALENVLGAKDEAALKSVLTAAAPTVDIANAPQELAALKNYFAVQASAGADKFIPDPNAWQNKDFWSFAAEEVQRAETWPFFVGFVVVNLLLGFGLASALPKDIRKTSKYAQLVEGKGHHEEAAHH